MAGVQTDVCLTQTALTAIDRGYEVYVVVDALAAPNKEIHDTAVMRLAQAGAIPTNWLAIGSELQRSWTEQETAPGFANLLYGQLTSWGHLHALTENVQKFAAKSGAVTPGQPTRRRRGRTADARRSSSAASRGRAPPPSLAPRRVSPGGIGGEHTR